MDGKIIFIGGIHGVGKGFVCERIVAETGLEYLSSSALIKWAEISPEKGNKLVDNIPSTQERLLTGLAEICKPSGNYLLDGHYCLLNANSIPTRIESDIFEKILPVLFILIHDTPQNIQHRLETRDAKNYNIELVTKMLDEEKKYAEELSLKLDIPLWVTNPNDIEPVLTAIKSQL